MQLPFPGELCLGDGPFLPSSPRYLPHPPEHTPRPQSQFSSIINLTRFIYELRIKYAGRGETLPLFLESVCKGKPFRNSTKMYLAGAPRGNAFRHPAELQFPFV